MKKLTIIFIILSQIAFGQSNNRQTLGLSIGGSLPQGDFRKDLLNDSTSGFAKTGVALEFTYMYRLSHNFGVQLIINYSSNAFNINSYTSALELEHPDYGVSAESTKNWSSGGAFVGPYLRLPLGSKLSIDLRALGGFMGSYTPEITIYTANKENPNDKSDYHLTSSRGSNFGYIIGGGFKYRMRSNIYILANINYYKANIDFKKASGWDWDDEPFTESFNQSINYIGITGGIGYIL